MDFPKDPKTLIKHTLRAAQDGSLCILQELIENHDVDVNCLGNTNSIGDPLSVLYTPIVYCINQPMSSNKEKPKQYRTWKCCEYLLEKGANLDAVINHGYNHNEVTTVRRFLDVVNNRNGYYRCEENLKLVKEWEENKNIPVIKGVYE